MTTFFSSIDQTVLFYIHANLHSPLLDKIMILATAAGDNGLIWILLSLLFLINKKTRNIGITALIALIVSTILGEGLVKNIIQRPRPHAEFPWIHLLIDKYTSYSFPSGHTSSSFAVAYVLSKYLNKFSLVIWVIAILIAFSRLYLFMHYPSDIVAGVVLGLLCGRVATYLYERQFTRA